MPGDLVWPEGVSRETQAALSQYHDAVVRWSARINLVSGHDVAALWDRHIRDSAQLYNLAGPFAGAWCDLGAGGGLPGLVVAILAKHDKLDRRHVLIESDQRKCAFLRVISAELGLNVQVLAGRAEQLPAVRAACVSARALAPMNRLLPLVARHLDPAGVALLPKGAHHLDELATVSDDWTFDLDIRTSSVSADSVILLIRNLEHRAKP